MEEGSTTIVGEDFLQHYGVLGMHWGVRNDRSGSLSSMSDEDLNKVLKRMRLESEYKRLRGGPNAHSVSNGLKFVNNNRKQIVETGATLAAITPFAVKWAPRIANVLLHPPSAVADILVPASSVALGAATTVPKYL